NEFGAPITGLTSADFTTAFDGVSAAVSFAETATLGTYVGTLNISAATAGFHTLSVTVTDVRALSATATASVSITNPISNTVRVQSITYSLSGGLDGRRNLGISVLVVDGFNAPVPNAIVSVILYRNGFFYGAANGMSGANGRAGFEASAAPAGCYQMVVAAVLA